MKNLIKKFISVWKTNYHFKTFTSSAVSTISGLVFVILNGSLGILYKSLWNGTICIYYILLTVVRGIIVWCQRKEEYRNDINSAEFRTKISRYTHILLFILNIALIVPIAIMVKGERNYNSGLIYAIAMAAYTTYRIVMSIINLKKAKKENNCLVRELRAINMVDALVAVLTLQNALIIANGGDGATMLTLKAYTSGGIFILIVIITVRSMIVNKE